MKFNKKNLITRICLFIAAGINTLIALIGTNGFVIGLLLEWLRHHNWKIICMFSPDCDPFIGPTNLIGKYVEHLLHNIDNVLADLYYAYPLRILLFIVFVALAIICVIVAVKLKNRIKPNDTNDKE